MRNTYEVILSVIDCEDVIFSDLVDLERDHYNVFIRWNPSKALNDRKPGLEIIITVEADDKNEAKDIAEKMCEEYNITLEE